MQLLEPSFQRFVQLCCDTEEILHHLLKNNRKLQGKKPSVLRASIVWLLAQSRGIHITQHDLSLIYGVTEQIIRENAQQIKSLLKEIVPTQ